MHTNLEQYTWHSSHTPPIFLRIDYFFISENLKKCVVSSKHRLNYKSDHSPVALKLDIFNFNRGPGYFKLNNSLLVDVEYQQKH